MPQPRRVVALTLLVLAGCTPAAPSPAAGTPPAQTPLAQPTASPVLTPTPGAPSPLAPTAWTPVADQEDVQAVQFDDVLSFRTSFVAAAGLRSGGGAFLSSLDGLEWHIQHGPPGAPALPNPRRLAAGPDGLVAIGMDDEGRPVSWYSEDGLDWSNASRTFGEASGSNDLEVTDVVSTGTGWLAVGREDPRCSIGCGLDPVRALVWTSSDGLDWTRVPNEPSRKGGAMTSVTATGAVFIAVGSVGLNAAAWTSTDGTTWARTPDAPVFHEALSASGDAVSAMFSVAFGHGVIVAVGTEFPFDGPEAQTARAWWSTDGETWHEGAGERFAEGQLFAVASTPGGFLATGPSGPASCQGLWASETGRDWRCGASGAELDGMTPYAAAASEHLEVVVGFDGRVDNDDGYPGWIWTRSIP